MPYRQFALVVLGFCLAWALLVALVWRWARRLVAFDSISDALELLDGPASVAASVA